ncbi:mCG1038252 [Mus musculus]|nr:mCG1038252 [Mus musculus]
MTEACDSDILNCLKINEALWNDSVHSCPQPAGSKACRNGCGSQLRRADSIEESGPTMGEEALSAVRVYHPGWRHRMFEFLYFYLFWTPGQQKPRTHITPSAYLLILPLSQSLCTQSILSE